jgi:phosphoglycerate dehydrogenase-like enzyme
MTSQVLIVARDAAFFAHELGARFSGLTFHAALETAGATKVSDGCDILLIRTDEITAALIEAMPRLRLIQALTTGTDHIEALPNLPAGVTIAAARGFHGPAMSELAFLFMLGLARDIRTVLANQQQHQWDRRPQRLLLGKTVTLVGVGRIAEELAQRCQRFGMRVEGVASARTSVPGFDLIHPRPALRQAAAAADFLIVLAPSTPQNRHLIDAAVLDAMKPSAALINLARGDVVDEAALIRTLTARRIAGAGLDVFQTEPLPPTSPLWDLPNVLITSHVGGMSDIYGQQVLPLLIDNLTAFVAGTPERMRFIVRNSNAKG